MCPMCSNKKSITEESTLSRFAVNDVVARSHSVVSFVVSCSLLDERVFSVFVFSSLTYSLVFGNTSDGHREKAAPRHVAGPLSSCCLVFVVFS